MKVRLSVRHGCDSEGHHGNHPNPPSHPSLRTGLRILSIAILSALSTRLPGQAVYGSIVGTVTDPSGAVVPNATITVTNVNKGVTQTATTNLTGGYIVTRLIPDAYTVKVEVPGFTPEQSQEIPISANQTQEVNLTLRPGPHTETVTVSAAAPPLETNHAEVQQTLGAQQLATIPNMNRNASQFQLLMPGTQRASFNNLPTENPQGTQSVEANGSNYGTQGWQLDGTDNREPVLGIIVINPTLNSLSEIRTITQNYPAEFGGAVGGFVVAQTKSGGNQLHGDAFYFRRSGEFMARDPFTQYPGVPFPGQLYNLFGGSISGPIRRDRNFFFLDYQGTRQRLGSTLNESVPTDLVRSTCLSGGLCDLSQYGTAFRDPGTGAVYADPHAIPASVLTPQGIALLSQMPAPNSGPAGATANNFVASGNGGFNADQADLRLDAQVSERIHAFGRYDYALFRLFGDAVFGPAGGEGFGLGDTTGNDTGQNQSVAAGFDWALDPRFLTDLRFGFLDYHVNNQKLTAGTAPAAAIGLPNLNGLTPETTGSPTFNVEDGSISNFGNQQCNCPLGESEQVFQVASNWTLLRGNHTIRFGTDLRYGMNLRIASDFNSAGQLTFGNGSTAIPGSSATTGAGIASVLFGYVDTFQRYNVYAIGRDRQKRGALYAQDSWRIRPRFTVDYGVRWDIVFPETVNGAGRGGFTDLPNGVIRVAGVGPFGTNGGANVDLSNFGGRLGFAWQFRDRSVLRAAGAQIFDTEGFFGTIFGTALTHNIPVYLNEDVTSGNAAGGFQYAFATLPARPAQIPIPASGIIPIPSGLNANWRPNTLLLPKVNQWNVSLQQQLTDEMTATIAYVGNLAERIYPGETYGFNPNIPVLPTTPADLTAASPMPPVPCVPGSAAGCSRDQRRPYYNRFNTPFNGSIVNCCSQDLTSLFPAARAYYNALQATVEQRLSHRFNLLANYTWSRALNYAGTYFAIDPRVEYGPSDTNRTHVFTLAGFWQLPVGRGSPWLNHINRATDLLIGGWQLAGTTTWESGLPFTPTYGECGSDQDIDTNFGTPGSSSDCRPDRTGAAFPTSVGSLNPQTHSRTFFTPVAPLASYGSVSGAFARPAFGTFGNVGRNLLRGPSDFFADATLFKDRPVTDRVRLQMQLQAFNVFNHVPLGLPSNSITNSRCIDCLTGQAGQITSVDAAVSTTGLPYMRTLQFGARLQF